MTLPVDHDDLPIVDVPFTHGLDRFFGAEAQRNYVDVQHVAPLLRRSLCG